MYQGFYLFVSLFNKYNVILTSEIEYNFWYAKRIITFYKPLNMSKYLSKLPRDNLLINKNYLSLITTETSLKNL